MTRIRAVRSDWSGLTKQEYNRQWAARKYQADPEVAREKQYAWRAAKREKYLAARRANYKKNAEREKARSRAWGLANPEKVVASRRRYYVQNSVSIIERAKTKRHQNPVKSREYVKRRRARKAGAVGYHTTEEWQNCLAQHNNKCFYCRTDKEFLTQDHMTPLSRGGSDWIENIVPACKSCNSQKCAKTVEEYIEWRRK